MEEKKKKGEKKRDSQWRTMVLVAANDDPSNGKWWLEVKEGWRYDLEWLLLGLRWSKVKYVKVVVVIGDKRERKWVV